MSGSASTIQIDSFDITDAHLAFDRTSQNAAYTYGNLSLSGSLAFDAFSASVSYVPTPPTLNATIQYHSSTFDLNLALLYDGSHNCVTNPGKHMR
jgi:hypothetical protein